MKTCHPDPPTALDLRPVVYLSDAPMTASGVCAVIEDCSQHFWKGLKPPSLRTVQRAFADLIPALNLDIKSPDGSNIVRCQNKTFYSPAICQQVIEDLGYQVRPISEAPFVPLAYGK